MIITMRHVRKAGMCSRGARLFCSRLGWNWSGFLKNGVDEKTLLETGDAMAKHLVEVARKTQ